MNDLEVSLQDTQDISTQVYDINYIPDYVNAEQERRANEVQRQANELLRIALYEDLENKKNTDYWRGNGIASIEKTDIEGLVDTYTITYENGYTSTFTVTNGKYDRIVGANATIDDNIGTPSVTVNTTSISAPDGTGYIKRFSFNFSNLKGEKGEQGERGEAGSIQFLIVTELPSTGDEGTIYLVPITPDEGDNNYAEYIYVNGEWELLGKIGVHVDLTDYYTKGETNTLLNAKENTSNKVTSINSSSTDTQYPSSKCVYDSQATQDTKITNLENQVFGDETIEAENTSMTLDRTLKSQFNELDLKGNTSQTGTPTPSSPIPVNVVSGDNEIIVNGKNLLNNINFVKGRLDNGVLGYASNTTNLITTQDSIEFTTNANYRGVTSDYIVVQPSTDYVYQQKNTLSGLYLSLACYDSNKTYLGNPTITNVGTSSRKITMLANTKFFRINIQLNTAGTIKLEELMLFKGSSATTYEPYIGNTYNIDLPVENKWYIDNATNNGVTLVNNEDGSITLKNSCTSTNQFRTTFSTALSNDTYTLSVISSMGFTSGSLYIRTRNSNGVLAHNIDVTSTSATQTVTSDIKYIDITIINGVNYNNVNLKIQLEKGSKQNTFTPYGTTPIELCKIGNYQDYFYKEDDKWYLHKEIGKVVLNGSEDWYKSSSYSTSTYFAGYTAVINTLIKNNSYNVMCDNFTLGLYTSVRDNECIGNNGETLNIQILASRLSENTFGAFKTWLSTHNTTVYYILVTPTDTEIPYQPLTEQLNAIKLATSKKGQTNISQINNDLPFIISASAFLNNINGKIGLLNKLTEV